MQAVETKERYFGNPETGTAVTDVFSELGIGVGKAVVLDLYREVLPQPSAVEVKDAFGGKTRISSGYKDKVKSIFFEISLFLLFTGVATFSVYFLARFVLGI
jgi:hypothetical protein